MVELREARVLEPGDVDYARAQAGYLHWEVAPLDDPEVGDDWVLLLTSNEAIPMNEHAPSLANLLGLVVFGLHPLR